MKARDLVLLWLAILILTPVLSAGQGENGCRSESGRYRIELAPGPGQEPGRPAFFELELGPDGERVEYQAPWLQAVRASIIPAEDLQIWRGTPEDQPWICRARKTPLECKQALIASAAMLAEVELGMAVPQPELAEKRHALRCARERLTRYARKLEATKTPESR